MRSRWIVASIALLAAVVTGGCATQSGAGGTPGIESSYAGAMPSVSMAPAPPGLQPPSPAAQVPVDPWPVQLDLSNATVLVYSPQVNSWNGNTIDFRCAVGIKAAGSGAESFGVVWATARTQVDRVERTVVFEDLKITKYSFPALANNGAAYVKELSERFVDDVRTVALDRLTASLARAGIQPPTVAVRNEPPRIIVSYVPAILVPISGSPVVRPVPNSGFERVINTGAAIMRPTGTSRWFLHVYNGWLSSPTLAGPWTQAFDVPFGLAVMAQQLASAGTVDLLDGGPNANPKPALAGGMPVIYTSEVPAELIVFRGQPNFVPITGTALLWAQNTTADVIVNTANNAYFVLVAGRWFTAPSLNGPWAFVAGNALPADFAKIPPTSPAGVVLATVAGTTQAQEAVIENSIPQTATVLRSGGPTFEPHFDGAPEYAPIAGTTLSYVVNSPTPIIQVGPSSWFALSAGVWFTAPQVTGPWTLATTVPPPIYTIPPSSPLHYVTYVNVYGYTPQVVYVGYTPGYLGTVVGPYGTVVYGTGYAYSPWIGTVWYPPPATYGVAAAPVYNPAVGYTFGFALGLATTAWAVPYFWGGYYGYSGYYYHPAYWGAPCCGSATANVYRNWGTGVSSGTRTWYSNPSGYGTAASGSYSNYRTGVSGNYSGYRNYNYSSGWAQGGYSRSGTGQAGGTGNVSRSAGYNTYSGQRYYNSSADVTGPGGSSVDRTVSDTGGPQGFSRSASTTTYNAKTGQTNTWNDGVPSGDNHYASSSGEAMRSTGSGWQQHSASGWGAAGGDSSWASHEQQARSSFEGAADRNGGWGDHFGGGGGFGDHFGGGGFGDRFSGGFGDRFGGGFGGFRGGGFRR